ncbi:acetyltransferase [Halomonas sp. SSL-5]|uniref:acetyltransferase n=1 Tax=Halomonas sp. SSL-5 TaxID=3065855 RepID=UPI002739C04E|nr:acetyltransferase [Halomonas sp. SSL-5]MDY7116724.1 acetyltransferase [Halomonas sp. SSL-5]
MTDTLYAVYGASGFGREVLPVARKQMEKADPSGQLVFIDDGDLNGPINGYEVLSYPEFLFQSHSTKKVTVAIANSEIRQRVAQTLKADGVSFWDVQADNVEVLDGVQFDEGVLLCPFVTLTSNIRIGKQFHANIYSYVAHDCVIGDFVTFAPRVCCNGNVHIEDHAYIGTGAVLKQGAPGEPLVIGRGAVVGMGAVVTKNVPPGAVVVGNPAKPFVKPST